MLLRNISQSFSVTACWHCLTISLVIVLVFCCKTFFQSLSLCLYGVSIMQKFYAFEVWGCFLHLNLQAGWSLFGVRKRKEWTVGLWCSEWYLQGGRCQRQWKLMLPSCLPVIHISSFSTPVRMDCQALFPPGQGVKSHHLWSSHPGDLKHTC